MRTKRKVLLTIVLVGLSCLVIFTGTALAQDSTQSPKQSNLMTKVASNLGIGEQELREAVSQAWEEVLNEAVDQGRITEKEKPLVRWVVKYRLQRALDEKGILRNLRYAEIRFMRMKIAKAIEEGKFTPEQEECLLNHIENRLDKLVDRERITLEQKEFILKRIEGRLDKAIEQAKNQ